MQNLKTMIVLKDARGNTIGEKEVATYAGLLSRAHEEGLVLGAARAIIPVHQVPEAGHSHVPWRGSTCYPWSGQAAGFL